MSTVKDSNRFDHEKAFLEAGGTPVNVTVDDQGKKRCVCPLCEQTRSPHQMGLWVNNEGKPVCTYCVCRECWQDYEETPPPFQPAIMNRLDEHLLDRYPEVSHRFSTKMGVDEMNRHINNRLEEIQREHPEVYRTFLGERLHVPPQRKPDYPHFDYAAIQDALLMASGSKPGETDCTTVVLVNRAWVSLGKTTLFLERELAQALMRTDLPEGFVADDILWRHPAFRLFIPSGLFRWESDDGVSEPTCATIVRFRKGEYLPAINPETGGVIEQNAPNGNGGHTEPLRRKLEWDRLGISMQMRESPESKWASPLYTGCVLDDMTLTEISKRHFTAKNKEWTLKERTFLQDIRRLVFNVLLYLGSVPEGYTPETVIRPGKLKKGQWRAEIKQARFVGQELYRPEHRPTVAHAPTGRRLPGHWRAGAWKRVPYGPQHSLRRLTWIHPYRTHGPEASNTEKAA